MQKLRDCNNRHDRDKLCGCVEVDEFFIGAKNQIKEAVVIKEKQLSL
jgi:hypothetical protein